jgi:hypothetical protein
MMETTVITRTSNRRPREADATPLPLRTVSKSKILPSALPSGTEAPESESAAQPGPR